MEWLELHIDTTHAGLDTVEATLSALGIDGVVIDDETEFQDFLAENRQYWDYVDEDLSAAMAGKSRITFYLPADETGFSQLGQVRLALERGQYAFGQVLVDNGPSLALQKKAGLTVSEDTLYWLFRPES